ncbi:hypothetical protein [Cryobacterium sp. Y29]|uniref:hypothetical protein n=1 Tax=Cryobacterium sp. Y29 TaxID=2048285 RepID=UPI000CE353FF|nr:hypothetical protein [Cryobacterium sp. Y29]
MVRYQKWGAGKVQSSVEKLAQRLRCGPRCTGLDTRILVHEGQNLLTSDSPNAKRLNDAGASWDWVALSIDAIDFWDCHVGMLADLEKADHFRVGLHWSRSADKIVRPMAAAILGPAVPDFSPAAGEFQLCALSEGKPVSVPTVNAADIALDIAAAFLDLYQTQ